MNKIKLRSFFVVSCLVSFSVFAEMPATIKHNLKPINSSIWTAQEANAEKLEGKLLKMIDKSPANKEALSNLAALYLLNNKTVKAIKAYQNAINYDATNPKLFAALSIAYLHQSKYSMAQAMANEALALDPTMKHAEKIKEYISKKEAVIAEASKVSAMPKDSAHEKAAQKQIH